MPMEKAAKGSLTERTRILQAGDTLVRQRLLSGSKNLQLKREPLPQTLIKSSPRSQANSTKWRRTTPAISTATMTTRLQTCTRVRQQKSPRRRRVLLPETLQRTEEVMSSDRLLASRQSSLTQFGQHPPQTRSFSKIRWPRMPTTGLASWLKTRTTQSTSRTRFVLPML